MFIVEYAKLCPGISSVKLCHYVGMSPIDLFSPFAAKEALTMINAYCKMVKRDILYACLSHFDIRFIVA